jgi:hypothetical protein
MGLRLTHEEENDADEWVAQVSPLRPGCFGRTDFRG